MPDWHRIFDDTRRVSDYHERTMRIALVSPYSWTYPGGVTRHIEALAGRFIEDGQHVRVLAPFDPPDRLSAALHRGAKPQRLEAPDYLISLGVPASNIDVEGYGPNRPVADNATTDGRARNRRVEIVISGGIVVASAGSPSRL